MQLLVQRSVAGDLRRAVAVPHSSLANQAGREGRTQHRFRFLARFLAPLRDHRPMSSVFSSVDAGWRAGKRQLAGDTHSSRERVAGSRGAEGAAQCARSPGRRRAFVARLQRAFARLLSHRDALG